MNSIAFWDVTPYNLVERSPVAYLTTLEAGEIKETCFDSWWGCENILLFEASRLFEGPSQPATQCVPGVISSEIKRPRREPDRLPLSSAEVKIEWNY
jgi:hypothetical protein